MREFLKPPNPEHLKKQQEEEFLKHRSMWDRYKSDKAQMPAQKGVPALPFPLHRALADAEGRTLSRDDYFDNRKAETKAKAADDEDLFGLPPGFWKIHDKD